MAAVLIGYFVFLFRASDREYREVIDEKFDDKKDSGSGDNAHVDSHSLMHRLGHLGRARAVDALRLVQDRHDLSEEVLTSSREGELEAVAEKHRV